MYYRKDGVLVENPIWYNVINGFLIVNLRKLKVIFNKGEEGKEEIYEFVITRVAETHTDGQLHCEVTAEGLAFQELGKIGYKISLSSEAFLDEYETWYNAEVGEGKDYPSQDKKDKAEPKNNIDYWCKKIFTNSKWDYEVQMDWSAFDGVTVPLTNDEREARKLRRTDKIYEEEYVSSWEYQEPKPEEGLEGKLIPSNMEAFTEKLRLVDLEKSNIYNLTQSLAETFGVFCKYKYLYDRNYHIIGKKCIFYNNFLSEKDGRIDIIYPYSTSKIEREIDSADVVTKMFVTPIEDTTTASGLVTIADVVANKMREDYILNFDYLYSIGTITQEQYDAIADYERSMYLTNVELDPISLQISNLQNDLVKYKAQLKIAQESKLLDIEQMEQASKAIAELSGEEGYSWKTREVPIRGVLQKMEGSDKYYIKVSQEGIDTKSELEYPLTVRSETTGEGETAVTKKYTTWAKGLRIFYYGWTDETTKAKVLLQYKDSASDEDVDLETEEGDLQKKIYAPPTGVYPESVTLRFDEYGNLAELRNLELKPNALTSSYFITCAYKPSLYYQNIYDTYERKLAKDEAQISEAETQIEEIEKSLKNLEKKYKNLLEEKAKRVADFENMMGPALREGSWQADNYTDYGSKCTQEIIVGQTNSSLANFEWDSLAFDEEQLFYYEVGVERVRVYYFAIDLSNYLDIIKNNLQNLSFIYDQPRSGSSPIIRQMTVGAEAQFAFANIGGVRKPILLLLDKTFKKEDYTNFRLGTITSASINNPTSLTSLAEKDWVELKNAVQIFPRIKVESLSLKTSADELIIQYRDETLKDYYDYYILVRGENHYITLKNELMLRDGKIDGKVFNMAFSISNAALALYLDALEVSKTNAYPQVSYDLEVSGLNRDFIEVAYKNLNRVVSITDTDLKLENVQGYISELELNLENPWEDKITVKNYKTKFEDLFSSIVASAEQMKTNSFAYNNAAGAFGPGGTLKPSIIQNTLNQVDLTYAFQSGNLTIDEINGIWARSDAGVVAIRGGGIFCATEQDSNGNWLWNTGIMPSGINASLITAGQLDTNLVRIFAGDNLRLQLNADGLFAYKVNEFGNANLNRYIVHNSEGLFSTVKSGNNSINLVEVSWDGFFIRDENNIEHFSATPDGNLTITGKITATSGKIGPWNITDKGLRSEDGWAGLVCAPEIDDDGKPVSDYYEVFWVTGALRQNDKQNKCYITNDGTLFCNNIRASGFISSNSFIGNTSGDEINGALKNISLTYDGARFVFDNRNYDGNLIVDPTMRYLFVNKNALTFDEFGEATEGFSFYYNYTIDENTNMPDESAWHELDLQDEELTEEFLIWKPESLTFILKDDIMYIGQEETEGIKIPYSSIFFKVEKIGKSRKINPDTLEVEMDKDGKPILEENTTYSSTVQFFADNRGVGKLISPLDPPSYTFVEDRNISPVPDPKEQEFIAVLTGFTLEEAYNSYWRIEGEEKIYSYLIKGDSIGDGETESGTASIFSEDEEVVINGVKVEENTTLDGNKAKSGEGDEEQETDQDKLEISLKPQGDGTIHAIAKIGYDKIPVGGNVAITFCMDSATRTSYCFRQRIGQDTINIILRSSSGSTLTTGDLSTILSIEVWSGRIQLNDDFATEKFYYLWKKDGKAMSSFKQLRNVSITDPETAEISIQENIIEYKVQNKVPSAGFFEQKDIYITAADFGIKSDYRCDVFTTLQDAMDEYLQNNENEDENWDGNKE